MFSGCCFLFCFFVDVHYMVWFGFDFVSTQNEMDSNHRWRIWHSSKKLINSEFDDSLVSDQWSLDCSSGYYVSVFQQNPKQEHHLLEKMNCRWFNFVVREKNVSIYKRNHSTWFVYRVCVENMHLKLIVTKKKHYRLAKKRTDADSSRENELVESTTCWFFRFGNH